VRAAVIPSVGNPFAVPPDHKISTLYGGIAYLTITQINGKAHNKPAIW